MERSHSSIKKLPDSPGVYFFIGAKQEVLYIGKATSLKRRVNSYFSSNLSKARGYQIVKMVQEAKRVDFRNTESVLEALILEAKLIKELKPTYNTRDKDDKSFNHLVITVGEEFPRLLTVRGKDLNNKIKDLKLDKANKKKPPIVYGPFPHASQFKESLKIIRKIFPYYDTKERVKTLFEQDDRKLEFNSSIGVYPSKDTNKKEYLRTIKYIKTLFDGKMKTLLKTMERDMLQAAKQEHFELAGVLKKQLFSLQHIKDVSLIKKEDFITNTDSRRIEGYDIAHLQGSSAVGVMVVVLKDSPRKSEYRTFNIKNNNKGSDTHALKEVLERRLAHPEWLYPRLIVVDGGRSQLNTAIKVLEKAGADIPVVAVTKDERHRPKQIQGPKNSLHELEHGILLANAEAHRFALSVHKRKRSKDFVK